MISPEVAIEEARRGLGTIQLDEHSGLAAVRFSGHAGIPLLVTRLDLPGQGYYLVPWQDERGIHFLIQVDAVKGAMLSAAVFPAPLQRVTLTAEKAGRLAVEGAGVRVTGEPTLVWQPCRETPSPFNPLYQVPVEDGHVYVSVDGTLHRRLTPFGKGG